MEEDCLQTRQLARGLSISDSVRSWVVACIVRPKQWFSTLVAHLKPWEGPGQWQESHHRLASGTEPGLKPLDSGLPPWNQTHCSNWLWWLCGKTTSQSLGSVLEFWCVCVLSNSPLICYSRNVQNGGHIISRFFFFKERENAVLALGFQLGNLHWMPPYPSALPEAFLVGISPFHLINRSLR